MKRGRRGHSLPTPHLPRRFWRSTPTAFFDKSNTARTAVAFLRLWRPLYILLHWLTFQAQQRCMQSSTAPPELCVLRPLWWCRVQTCRVAELWTTSLTCHSVVCSMSSYAGTTNFRNSLAFYEPCTQGYVFWML